VLILRRANGRRGDTSAEIPGGVNGEGAPTATNFQDAIARFDSQLAADEVKFLLLTGVQRIFAATKIRAGVEHLRIEKKTVKAIPEVVVRSNISPAALHTVSAPAVPQARRESANAGEEAVACVQESQIAHGHTHERHQ